MTQRSNPDPDLGRIGPGHICKHGIRWPHACDECDEAAWSSRVRPPLRTPNEELEMTDTLWCCHIQGPDDVHAAGTKEEAQRWANAVNALNIVRAVVEPWPWSAEAHAADLPHSRASFANMVRAA